MFRTREGREKLAERSAKAGRVDSAQLIIGIGLGGVRATESIRLHGGGGGKKSGYIRRGRIKKFVWWNWINSSVRRVPWIYEPRKNRAAQRAISNLGSTSPGKATNGIVANPIEFLPGEFGRERRERRRRGEEERCGKRRGFKLNYRGRKRGGSGTGYEGERGEVGSVARASRQRDKRGQKRAKQMSVNNRLRPAARRSTPWFAGTSVSVPLFH